VPWVGVAYIGVVGGDDQPPVPDVYGRVSEPEVDHGPSGWDQRVVDVAVYVPKEQLRIKVLVTELADPAGSPPSDGLYHLA
jgi:hypothetical protein